MREIAMARAMAMAAARSVSVELPGLPTEQPEEPLRAPAPPAPVVVEAPPVATLVDGEVVGPDQVPGGACAHVCMGHWFVQRPHEQFDIALNSVVAVGVALEAHCDAHAVSIGEQLNMHLLSSEQPPCALSPWQTCVGP